MNWLAHTFLSERHIEFQLGNLLADLVRGPARERMSEEFKRGAACHKAIDAFTDAHPIVHRSRLRLGAEHRRFSGVLIDIYYDHLLARHWSRYSSESLRDFATSFYRRASEVYLPLPRDAQMTLDRIVRHDSLVSYESIVGVERALRRISTYLASRWGKTFALEDSIPAMQAQEAGLEEDFAEFFPELRQHIKQNPVA